MTSDQQQDRHHDTTISGETDTSSGETDTSASDTADPTQSGEPAVSRSDRRVDRRQGINEDRRQHSGAGRALIPGTLKMAALAVLVVGGVYLFIEGLREPPMLERRMAGNADGYRLETGRATPPAATTLSEAFIPVEGVEREQILQRLSEFRATWKVADPRIALTSTDVDGEADAFSEQLKGWLEQYNLLAPSAVTDAPKMAGIPGATLPAPPVSGLLIRCREQDEAIARDLALAIAPVIGGEVNIIFDERVSASRLQVALVGAPRFGENGTAYFRAA